MSNTLSPGQIKMYYLKKYIYKIELLPCFVLCGNVLPQMFASFSFLL